MGNLFEPLKVKIKLLKSPFDSKKTSLVCAKCLYLDRESSIRSTEWWIKINKQISYDRIELCKQTFSKDVDKVFEKYADFVGISDLKCIPNMYSSYQSQWKYFKGFNQLVEDNGQFDVYKVEVINQLILNECYLSNIDKFKYIAVMDPDETVSK